MTKDTMLSILIGKKVILSGNWPSFMSYSVHNFGYYYTRSMRFHMRSVGKLYQIWNAHEALRVHCDTDQSITRCRTVH